MNGPNSTTGPNAARVAAAEFSVADEASRSERRTAVYLAKVVTSNPVRATKIRAKVSRPN